MGRLGREGKGRERNGRNRTRRKEWGGAGGARTTNGEVRGGTPDLHISTSLDFLKIRTVQGK